MVVVFHNTDTHIYFLSLAFALLIHNKQLNLCNSTFPHSQTKTSRLAEKSVFCSFCVRVKTCPCGASGLNEGPESCSGPGSCKNLKQELKSRKPRTPKWREEVDNWVKTSLQTIRGASLTNSTMSR